MPAATAKAVIFDLDGTLIDSNAAHTQSWVETFKAFGFDVDCEYIRRLIGMGSDKLLHEVTGWDADREEGKKLRKQRDELFDKVYLPGIKPFEHATDLMHAIHHDKRKIIVATGSTEEQAKHYLKLLHATEITDVLVTGDDAARTKPDPDIVEASLKKSASLPDQTVMLGDTPYDIAAASKAGVPCVALTCGGWTADHLAGARAIFADPADLLHHYEEFGRV